MNNQIINDLLSYLNNSPTSWHAVEQACKKLSQKGFIELKEEEKWNLQLGERYYINRKNSSLCAFILPKRTPESVQLFASHTDSPGFKLKPLTEIRRQSMVLLGLEIYGSPLLTSWLNRDLGIAGRVIYKNKEDEIENRLIKFDDFPLIIPQLAIHLDREVNEKGLLLNKQDHFHALAALEKDIPLGQSYLETILQRQLELKQLLTFDLFLYPLEQARLVGWQDRFISSYRIDSLVSVHAALSALIEKSTPWEEDIKMIMFWDHEEVGSYTAQGAESPFFNQTLERILFKLDCSKEDFFRILSQSHCTSIDLAHALHPNYIEKHDSMHQPKLGQGVVIKNNAQQRYATDSYSTLPIHLAAAIDNIPLQYFVSRNDMPCGSTIGPLHASQSGMPTVDIGCGQLSMHSSRELMASEDYFHLFNLLKNLMSQR
jgi:aspartyl aminopeptidase